MTQIIDFRNAKFQGQTVNGLPHGLGIMIDYKNIFSLAQWKNGNINGKCVVVFGDSKIFYGQIRNKLPIGICTYHLKDKCQIFNRFQSIKNQAANNLPVNRPINNNKIVALLPTFNMIINVEGEDEQQLEIIQQQVYKQGDFHSLKNILQNMLDWKFQPNQLQSLLSLENFIRNHFLSHDKYKDLLDILSTTTQQGTKQMFITIKTKLKIPSLGIKIVNCMQTSNSLTNRHNDGNSYIIKASGYFTKQGILEYGLKNIKTLIKGNVKQQAIYSNQTTIVRYQDQQKRPNKCSVNLLNEFKKSIHFQNTFLPIRYLFELQAECLNINFSIRQTQTKKYAQLVLQNPKQLTIEEKQKIQEGRLRKLNKGSIQKNAKNEATPNPYKKNIEEYSKKNQQLQKARQDIYRSVSKKKVNGSNISSPYIHAGTNFSNSPQKQIKPSQLTNVKPMLQVYKNSTEKSFYNSINKGSIENLNLKNIEGYVYQMGINSSAQKSKSKQKIYANINSQPSFQNTEYLKNLQNRRRLYQQTDLSRSPISKTNLNEHTNKRNPNRKKFSYLPDQESNINNYQSSSRKDNYQINKYKNSGSKYSPQRESIYEINQNRRGFRAQRKSPHNYTPDKIQYNKIQYKDSQTGKLGKRTANKFKPQHDTITNYNEPSYYQKQKYNKSINDPILVPQLKINNNSTDNYYKHHPRTIQTVAPKRQHHLRYQNDGRQYNKTPLTTQKYRRQYLQQTSPIRKIGISKNTPQKLRYQSQVIIDPSENYAKQDSRKKHDMNRQYSNSNLMLSQNSRNKSPYQKRKKILNDNPFQN